ncbi:Angiopoietin-like 1 [Operophtera brumata]|uniref:Angiopoietin-like 1 n=1 Tax=Operophtera brumata TaxID=104452 RepID=A0A0L7LBV1_OPEBR|nr:Angiopoietin-like 1 [Operophtera brumata]
MVPTLTLLQVIVTLSVISCQDNQENRVKLRNDHSDKLLWKKEFEDELTGAMLSPRNKQNVTVMNQSALSDNEDVIEKLIDTFTSSEKYLKKIDGIDFRLNRLDIEIHEKTNEIITHLAEIMKALREQGNAEKLETVLDTLTNDITQIKFNLDKKLRTSGSGDVAEYPEPSRLSAMESDIKYIVTALNTVVSTMSEVFQNRYDGSQDFYKSWSDFKYGFGNLAGEFWLGLEKLNYLTNQKLYELRVELETQPGQVIR